MAELEEGTYFIISAASGLALDVKGASDKSSVSVQQYTPNNGDAQIWAATQFDNGWQLTCSLSNKCLQASPYGESIVSGKDVLQYDDKNWPRQRWYIAADGNTYTYKNVVYDTYKLYPYTVRGIALDAVGGTSATPGSNVRVYTSGTGVAQRWIFVPAPVFMDEGTYFICTAADPTQTLVVNAGSTANKANIFTWPMREVNHQKVRTKVDPETFNTVIYFAHSDKCMDVTGGVAANNVNVQQYAYANVPAQKWLPFKKGTVTYDGEPYPSYELRAVVGAGYTLDSSGPKVGTSGSNVCIKQRNNSMTQRFIFVKTERTGSDISQPGVIDQKMLYREGPGDVDVYGLTFLSKENTFQARYKVRRYAPNRASYVDSRWMNFYDDSESRSGWGDAWTSTFTVDPVEGRVTIPFVKTVTLDSEYTSADFMVEIRTYKNSYGAGYKATGPVAASTIKLLQTPSVSINSASFVNLYDGKFGIITNLADSLGEGCSFIRGRILGDDGEPMSQWQTSSSMTIRHYLGESLTRLPRYEESMEFEYSMLTNDGLTVSGKIPFTIDYAGVSSLSVEYLNDDSLSAVIQSDTDAYERCFIDIPYHDGVRTIECAKLSSSNAVTSWKCIPPLNQDVRVIKIGSGDGASWTYGEEIVHIDSHLFIWNWTDIGSVDMYSSSAAIIINSDSPPDQTRKYTSDIKFSSPAGRVYPVAFSSVNISEDLSIAGVVIDDGAPYQAAGPIPENTKLPKIKKLITLSGKGIHPIYRTPYGDWRQVGIETIDISKSEMYISTVNVTQRSVED